MTRSQRDGDLTPCWVDDVAVDRLLAGQPVGRRLHEAERVEVARRVLAAGGGFNRLMALLRCSGDLAKRLIDEAHPPVQARAAHVNGNPPTRTHHALYQLCLAGREPAESLPPVERARLVAELHDAGWTDQQIADHTRMTLYTTARIRASCTSSAPNHHQRTQRDLRNGAGR